MLNKKWQLPFLLFLIIGTVLIIHSKQPHSVPYQKEEGTVFGTIYHTTYQCDSSLHDEIMAELQRVDNSLSMFNPHSTISRINRGETEETDSLLQFIFNLSKSISECTDGCFDVTVAPLVNAWGFGFKNGALPDSAQVDSIRSHIGWQRITLDADGMLHKEDSLMVMDFSAVAKGFGADQVATVFRRHNITNFMIEIGGEIVASGKNPKGEDWNIGINKPIEDNTSATSEIETVLALSDCAMATSGNYRNFYYSEDGRKLAHTIDPHTGYPVQHSILSSTVLAPTCAMADAFATSFMVMGLEKAKELLKKQNNLDAYFIYADEEGKTQTWMTEGLKDKMAN